MLSVKFILWQCSLLGRSRVFVCACVCVCVCVRVQSVIFHSICPVRIITKGLVLCSVVTKICCLHSMTTANQRRANVNIHSFYFQVTCLSAKHVHCLWHASFIAEEDKRRRTNPGIKVKAMKTRRLTQRRFISMNFRIYWCLRACLSLRYDMKKWLLRGSHFLTYSVRQPETRIQQCLLTSQERLTRYDIRAWWLVTSVWHDMISVLDD